MEIPLDLYQRFAAQAARTPDAQALSDGHKHLTYRQLLLHADQLAAVLVRQIPTPGARIGLYAERGNAVVIAILAVLAAGHTYVPFDPGYPADRLRYIADDAALSAVVADQDPGEVLAGLPVLRMDRLEPVVPGTTAVERPASAPDSPAYVIYTSGSTGRPKGVEVSHRNVATLLDACDQVLDLGGADVWTLFHSHCFDFSVWEMWGALTRGARLVVVPADTASSPRALHRLLVEEGVTVLNQVPSVFRYLARSAARRTNDPVPGLRYVIFGGEPIDPDSVRSWRERAGDGTRFVNMYGITETTVFATYRFLDDAADAAAGPRDTAADTSCGDAAPDPAAHIGHPLPGYTVLVLDEADAPVAPGEVGEIHVAGAAVSLGYLGRPDLTAARFPVLRVPGHPAQRYYRSGDLARMLPDGSLEFAGRADDQVKINGFRIELGEVEAAMRTAPGVVDLVVAPVTTAVGDPVLAAFYTTEDDASEGVQERLLAHARHRLPAHMIPHHLVRLPELPLNASGKTDRRALADLVTR
ncbi:amino acid adenylation domain-containing protein [Streptomyces inhibens]|uniref:Amino acid adenylation domain-containing protein n=1 Tax=Streptomyces inhibens TaxID=2293571 RepID=A0A371PYY0_STRIH|nr:amino acid adenylation domain-containing protein [Streptomyces inhibens]REK87678.1 amino acid adenylation domain-containing protein [Streptomyces inhibens]